MVYRKLAKANQEPAEKRRTVNGGFCSSQLMYLVDKAYAVRQATQESTVAILQYSLLTSQAASVPLDLADLAPKYPTLCRCQVARKTLAYQFQAAS